jgi:hexulose-6-phosphate isomerase
VNKGVNRWCFQSASDQETVLRTARQAGFQGVELTLEESDLSGDLDRFRAARTLAQSLGLALPSLATDLFWKYPLSSADPTVNAKALSILHRQMDAAVALGADTILVVPGTVTSDDPYDAVYQRALDAVGSAARRARDLGVTIAVEEVWNRFLLSPLEFCRFLDEIDSPFVKAYFDVGNVVAFAYPEQWIHILGNRIKSVHVKDYVREVGTMAGFTRLLQGDVDWIRVMSALREMGYDGYLTAEVPP